MRDSDERDAAILCVLWVCLLGMLACVLIAWGAA